jgi:hypothetical protein
MREQVERPELSFVKSFSRHHRPISLHHSLSTTAAVQSIQNYSAIDHNFDIASQHSPTMTVCASCRRALVSSLRRPAASTSLPITRLHLVRTAATVPSSSSAAPANPPPPTAQTSTPATSSSKSTASQPFSSPTHVPQNTHKPAAADLARPPSTAKLIGSLPGGAEIKGLNYIKGAPPLIAKEDSEYPEWLWTILKPKASAADGQLAKGELAGTLSFP